MSSITYYFKDIKTVPKLTLKRMINDTGVSVKCRLQILTELERRKKIN